MAMKFSRVDVMRAFLELVDQVRGRLALSLEVSYDQGRRNGLHKRD
jgi:hypothetical protein